ncbi:glycosyl transferase family 1 [Acidobacteria bacterium Mor1]|nr:glycosyl transferase family 1 [Acidobacteria bacterium Mor1]
MNVLFMHQNFPGQFQHLAAALAAQPGNNVVFLTQRKDRRIPGVRKIVYKTSRDASKETHRYLQSFESATIRGQGVARALLQLAREGFRPDVICGHCGWGETMFVKDIFPDVPLINYFEFYYHSSGADAGFDPEFPTSLDSAAALRVRNSVQLLGLEACDVGLSPTRWQQSLYPQAFQDKIRVIHEGVDTQRVKPADDAVFEMADGRRLTAEDEVVTYVSRNLEPYRGFHMLMRALPELLRRRPRAQVVLVGDDGRGYGSVPADGTSWRETLLREVSIDASRVHFVGRLPYDKYLKLLQVSSAHVYFTYPFVLSWSALEAMAAGCALIASDTAPVREVVRDGWNGLLVDFFDRQGLVDRIERVLAHPDGMAAMRRRARKDVVERFDLRKVCLPAQLRLLDEVTSRHAVAAG